MLSEEDCDCWKTICPDYNRESLLARPMEVP